MKGTRQYYTELRSGAILLIMSAIAAVPCFAQQYVGIRTVDFNFAAAAQQQNEWCWAASIQMILNYYGIPATQQEIVTRTYGIPVDQPGSDAAINSALNGWGRTVAGEIRTIHSATGNGLPTPAILLRELAEQHPILVAFATGPNSGHAVVITAASYINGPSGPQVTSLVLRDPWPSPNTISTEGRIEIAGPNLTAFAPTVRAYWFVTVN
ncbi:C39 family peptidase [Tunturiibacter gelidoferens]|uniref:Uncharacterized protein n=1 Tax=Tunturiibacter gelidiferens TaxID=3069689 RepID=A0ACC5NTD4_9BACT|nr:papain-like cysteine protease family protein [Edaphobacter lichenicola]MBB5337832.1 hypothetical protein [Edaphobacter lichenicola]